jgi:hypothetical protein
MGDPPATDRGIGPMRCSTCRLLVGVGRSVPSDEPTAAGAGAAVGWIAAKARRDENVDAASPATVRAAIRTVAESLDDPVNRLRMVDYERESANRPSLPALADVFSAFGTWKKARMAAAGQAPG